MTLISRITDVGAHASRDASQLLDPSAGLNRCVDQLGADVREAGQNVGKGVALGLTIGCLLIGISIVASTYIVVHSRRDEAASSEGAAGK